MWFEDITGTGITREESAGTGSAPDDVRAGADGAVCQGTRPPPPHVLIASLTYM